MRPRQRGDTARVVRVSLLGALVVGVGQVTRHEHVAWLVGRREHVSFHDCDLAACLPALRPNLTKRRRRGPAVPIVLPGPVVALAAKYNREIRD
jgi:hypothetical protein